MSPQDLFGEGAELSALEELIGDRAGSEEAEDALLPITPLVSILYCTPVISLAISC